MYLENTADTNVASNLPLGEHVNSLLLFIVLAIFPKKRTSNYHYYLTLIRLKDCVRVLYTSIIVLCKTERP